MTAVNGDAGAVALFSIFLWSGVRAIRRRRTGERARWALALCTLSALLCPLVKSTAAVALALLPLVWVLTFVPALGRGSRAKVWLAVVGLLAAAVVLGGLFSWGDAALWYRVSAQPTPTRQKLSQAPLGDRALALEHTPGLLRQVVPEHALALVRGQTVTLGAWMWSTGPAEGIAPTLWEGGKDTPVHSRIQLDREPVFYAITHTVSSKAPVLAIDLYAAPDGSPSKPPIYYDGVVLAARDRTHDAGPLGAPAPQWDQADARDGTWAGRRFTNLARNGSAQAAAPFIRPQIDQAIERYTRRSPSRLLSSLLDWERSRGFYPIVARTLLQTFWARFGWNQVALPRIWYRLLGVVSLFCLVGAAAGVIRIWRVPSRHGDAATTQRQDVAATQNNAHAALHEGETEVRRRMLLLLGLAGAAIWSNAVLRFHPLGTKFFVPVARYAYPAILPTVLALVGGAWTLTQRRLRWLRVSLLYAEVVLAGVSLWTVATYPRYGMLPLAPPLILLALCIPAGWAWGRARKTVAPVRQRLLAWWTGQNKKRLLAYASLVLILLAAVAGVLYLGSTIRASRAVRNTTETRTQAMHAVNALVQELELEQATVGIASELQLPPLDLRQIDAELLYRLQPAAELVCQPELYDVLVLPSSGGTALTQQAVHTLSQENVPHVELREGESLAQQSPSIQPGILVAVPTTEHPRPEGCAPPRPEAEEWPPARLDIGDWEATIPDRHRPDEIPAHAWQADPACTDTLNLRILEDWTAAYSRLQEKGQKMQLALRGSVQTAPCSLAPGTYRLQWRARGERLGPDRSLLQVSVWEHPPDQPPRRVQTRVLQVRQAWTRHSEQVRVMRSISLSLKIEWLDGPGSPDLQEGQPKTALILEPKVQLHAEPKPPLGQALKLAWQNTFHRLVRR
jgi:hypothetical protein